MRFYGLIKNWAVNQKERFKASGYCRATSAAMHFVMKGSKNEVAETREMADTFFRLLSQKLYLKDRKIPPTEKEVKNAIEQLKDVARISVFATISILPGGGFSLIGLELLARKFGVKSFTFVPSSFRKTDKAAEKPNIK